MDASNITNWIAVFYAVMAGGLVVALVIALITLVFLWKLIRAGTALLETHTRKIEKELSRPEPLPKMPMPPQSHDEPRYKPKQAP